MSLKVVGLKLKTKISLKMAVSLLALTICMVFSFSSLAFGATPQKITDKELQQVITTTAAALQKNVPYPQIGTTGGEWLILGITRSDAKINEGYLAKYYQNLVAYTKANQGVLHAKKYTEYSRVILALTAMGKDPRDVGGYNFLAKLGDYEQVVWQGVNGATFALLALNSGNYEIPVCQGAKTQATKDLYIKFIIKQQLADGGFSLAGDNSDPDLTGMVLQAFAPYMGRTDVANSVAKALAYLSTVQDDKGGYASVGAKNMESTAQVLMALCELGIDPDDSRFMKNGNSLTSNLMSFYIGEGGFAHNSKGKVDGIATEQALYTLVNLQRVKAGKTTVYRMTDVEKSENPVVDDNFGLSGKNQDIKLQVITKPGKTFEDVQNLPAQKAIEALAAREIINGDTASLFAPNRTMTRAEFATIVVKGLGLTPKADSTFKDISASAWYAPYIGTAYKYGIIKGVAVDVFAPGATITKEEAATMISRAAKLCGLNTTISEAEAKDILAQFEDYTTCSNWATDSLAFVYKNNIFSQSDLAISPKVAIKRSEIAASLYKTLDLAELIK